MHTHASSLIPHTPSLLKPPPLSQYFPLIGAVVGLWGAAFFNAAEVLWPRSVAAAAAVLATVWLTGCFHEDGLADCIGELP